MDALMEVRQLRKEFGNVTAVDGIDFSIRQGTCFGLLGPNGAGKTTTVEMLEGITKPTSGEVLYKNRKLGLDFQQDAGIMFQTTALQDYITVREALELFASLYSRSVALDQLIHDCALEEFLNQDTGKLSGGQKQRVLLAIAMINDPVVLFLDEPTTGLDPQARRNFWNLLNKIKQEGKTIVLTTHYMEEASLLCDELVFVDHGKVIASGKPADLLADQFDDVILELPNSELDAANASMQDTDFQLVRKLGDTLEIKTRDVNVTVARLVEQGVSLRRLSIRARTLEDLFLELTGKELRA